MMYLLFLFFFLSFIPKNNATEVDDFFNEIFIDLERGANQPSRPVIHSNVSLVIPAPSQDQDSIVIDEEAPHEQSAEITPKPFQPFFQQIPVILPQDLCALGNSYFYGMNGQPNYRKAIELYIKSAMTGNPSAQFNIALCFEKGLGLNKNIKTAIEWYKLSAASGEIRALSNLGHCYMNGADDIPPNPYIALKYWEEAAQKGDALAKFNLGTIYCNHGCKNDVDNPIQESAPQKSILKENLREDRVTSNDLDNSFQKKKTNGIKKQKKKNGIETQNKNKNSTKKRKNIRWKNTSYQALKEKYKD